MVEYPRLNPRTGKYVAFSSIRNSVDMIKDFEMEQNSLSEPAKGR